MHSLAQMLRVQIRLGTFLGGVYVLDHTTDGVTIEYLSSETSMSIVLWHQ